MNKTISTHWLPLWSQCVFRSSLFFRRREQTLYFADKEVGEDMQYIPCTESRKSYAEQFKPSLNKIRRFNKEETSVSSKSSDYEFHYNSACSGSTAIEQYTDIRTEYREKKNQAEIHQIVVFKIHNEPPYYTYDDKQKDKSRVVF